MNISENEQTKLDFAGYILKHRELVDQFLERCLVSDKKTELNIVEVMRYSVFAGGKRLRPILVFAGGDLIKNGVKREKLLPFAAAIEMIHTYSLIHDDLPAMDNDDLRRGKPSCHTQFSEGLAILAGDALLTLAFELCSNNEEVSPEDRIKIISEYSSAAGYSGMVGGQVLDLEAEGEQIKIEDLKGLHLRKTSRLITAPLLAGAIVAGANEDQVEKIRNFGINLGHAFQIVDDILDVIGDEKTLGKKVGSDEHNEKVTYPSLCGVEKSREHAKNYIQNAKDALQSFGDRNCILYELADFVLKRSY